MKRTLQFILAIIILLVIAINTASANNGNKKIDSESEKALPIIKSRSFSNEKSDKLYNKDATEMKRIKRSSNKIFDFQFVPDDITREYINRKRQFNNLC